MTQFLQAILSGSSSSVPEGILAFRSITRLTSIIQQGPFSDLSDRKIAAEEDPRELTLSVAFSILAALEHEVVAVMAKPTANGLEVFVCSNSSYDKDRTFLQQIGDKVMDFMFTRNDRPRESQASKSEYPTIIHTSLPYGLKKESSWKELECYIDKLCEDNAPSDEPHLRFPLYQHLEVLRQLLTAKSTATQVTKDMLHYVVATSYMKMNNRMQKGPSIAYLNTLIAISTDNLDPVARSTDQSNARKDRNFLIYLSKFQEDWRSKFPKLYKLGTEVKLAQSPEGFELYSDDTRGEFHELFIMCLRGFANGLRELVKIRHPAKASKQSEDAKHNVGKRFEDYTSSVARHGRCLSKLARTHALQLHLRAILPRHPEPSLASPSIPTPELDGDQTVPGEEDEIEPLVIDTDMPPHMKPYRDWLKLIIAEFDAADILIQRFIFKPNVVGPEQKQGTISIKIVTPSSTNGAALPWKGLFQSSSYILDTLGGGINNEQLLQFLTNIESALPEASGWLTRFRESWKSHDVKKMQKMFKEQERQVPMTRYNEEMQRPGEHLWRLWLQAPDQPLLLLPDWVPILDELSVAFTAWKHFRSDALEADIQGYLKSLGESTKFFRKIAHTNRADGFDGRIHCEACLASLVAAIDTTQSVGANVDDQELLDSIKGLGDVIGVSKRCCPACAQLLKHVKHAKGNFHTRGSHNTVSPCSLPLWLPDGVVKHMNHDLGAMLRNELVALIKAPELHRKRANSTGSSGRSSSSDEQEELSVNEAWPSRVQGM